MNRFHNPQHKRVTTGYSEENIIRIQSAFEKDRPATYGDETDDQMEDLFTHLSKEEKQKIKMRGAAAGVFVSLIVKGP